MRRQRTLFLQRLVDLHCQRRHAHRAGLRRLLLPALVAAQRVHKRKRLGRANKIRLARGRSKQVQRYRRSLCNHAREGTVDGLFLFRREAVDRLRCGRCLNGRLRLGKVVRHGISRSVDRVDLRNLVAFILGELIIVRQHDFIVRSLGSYWLFVLGIFAFFIVELFVLIFIELFIEVFVLAALFGLFVLDFDRIRFFAAGDAGCGGDPASFRPSEDRLGKAGLRSCRKLCVRVVGHKAGSVEPCAGVVHGAQRVPVLVPQQGACPFQLIGCDGALGRCHDLPLVGAVVQR